MISALLLVSAALSANIALAPIIQDLSHPLAASKSQMDKLKVVPAFLHDSVLQTLGDHKLPSRLLENVADPDLYAKLVHPFQRQHMLRSAKHRIDIADIFEHLDLPAEEISSSLQILKVNVDDFVHTFSKKPFSKGEETKFRKAIEFYRDPKDFGKFMESLGGELRFSEPELALRQAEVTLAAREKQPILFLNSAFRADHQRLLSGLEDKFSSASLATIVKEWIPKVERADQIFISSVVMKLVREQETDFKQAAPHYDTFLFSQHSKHADEILQRFVGNLENKYGSDVYHLADHLKSIVNLNLYQYATKARSKAINRIIESIKMTDGDFMKHVASFKISLDDAVNFFQKKLLAKSDGTLFRNALRFYERASAGILEPMNEKRLLKEIFKIFKGVPRIPGQTQDLARRAKIVESAKAGNALEFLETVFMI